MDKTKIWVLASTIIVVGIVALGWFAGVEPQLAAKASTDEQILSVQAQNQVTELTNARLKEDFESIDALKGELTGLRGSIPAAGRLPDFLTQLDNLAAASRTKVTSLTVAEAVAYTVPATSVAPVESPVEGDAGESEVDADANADMAAEVEPAAPLVPRTITDSRITAENFVAIPVEVTVEGDRAGARLFLDKLQHGPRLFMATQISILPVEEKPGVFNSRVSGYVYVLLQK